MSEEKTTVIKTTVEKELPKQRRRTRNDINGNKQKLALTGEEPGFHYAWINDENVGDATDNDYEFVTHAIKVGSKHIDVSEMQGAKISRNVGGGKVAYLMRIPQEWYEENHYQDVLRPAAEAEEAITVELNSNGLVGTIERGSWEKDTPELWERGSTTPKRRSR
jgi:hypothetical protein